jgi:aflatoxin B1 aldehyde reductase
MSEAKTSVRVVLGTMTIGPAIGNAHMTGEHCDLPAWCQTPPDVALQQLQALASCAHARVASGPEAGKVLLDTASIYQNWACEETLGKIFAEHPDLRAQFSVHSKVNSAFKPHKNLSKASVLHQVAGSLQRLGLACLDVLYLHSPDIETDIDDTLEAIRELHESKKIKEFGLSNFPAWKVVDIVYRCRAKGMVAPTVYQGCYNAITRALEFELTPALRELGIRSYHYNPLAGGMLTGKYAGEDDDAKKDGLSPDPSHALCRIVHR